MRPLVADVAVIGGGPAGSVLATRLAQLGLEVCLLERARFPRRHVGESLSPGVLPMLASMGAAPAVEAAGFARVSEVSTNWGGQETLRRDPRQEGLLVDRGAFDAALLAHAAGNGVRVLQPATLRERVPTPEGIRLAIDVAGERLELGARFLADASGRSGAMPGRRRATGPRTIAIYAYWTGRSLPRRPRIEAGEREWSWGVPIPGGAYNTLVFVDSRRFRAEPGASLEGRLRALLERSALMRDVRGATLLGPVRAVDATPYLYEDCVSTRHIRVGEAALALDPLSSSGVQKAIQTALSGAIVVNTLVSKTDTVDAALQFYRDSVQDASARHRAWAAQHYQAVAALARDPFWTDRASGALLEPPASTPTALPSGDDVPLALSTECHWEATPCLGPRYVEWKTSLRHPQLDGPVAYLHGYELAPLLRDVPSGITSRQLARAWCNVVPFATGLSMARWLSGRAVLLPASRMP